jgi:DNA polymerase III subunit delta
LQVRLDDLEAQLARGLKGCYVVHGDETLLANEALDTVRAKARALGFSERQVFTVAGNSFDWSAVLAQAASQSLFAERQIVEIRIPSGKPGKDGGEALQRLAASLHEDLLLLVSLPRLDKTQLSSAWFTALDGAGHSLRAEPIERRALPLWLARRAAKLGLKLPPGDEGEQVLARLADRVEGNLLAAQQELDKLALISDGVLTLQDIDTRVTDVARFEAAQLGEALWSGQLQRCLRLLDALEAEGEAVVRLHWLLSDDVRALRRGAQALAAGQPLPMALRAARAWGAKERLFERVLPLLKPTQCDALLQSVQQLEGICKGLREPGWPAEPWAALRHWLLLAAGLLQGRALALSS